MYRAKDIFGSFINLIYPRLCIGCSEALLGGEKFICLNCLTNLPRTKFHNIKENEVEKRFYGKVQIEHATSFLYFEKKSLTQKLLHEIKYKGGKELAKMLGNYFGADMQNDFFKEIDAIIPIPLHPKRLKWRGFNQSEWIAMGISEVVGKPVINNAIERVIETQTQTKKGVYERWENVKDIFKLSNAELIKGKHLLVVDDVITTGSTIEACVAKLLEIKDVKISIASIAVTE